MSHDTAGEVDGSERARPRFSVIIPAWNEEKYLPRLLDSIDVAKARWGEGKRELDSRMRGNDEPIVNRQSAIVNPEIEVIVADNASTDRTAEIARERGCRVAFVEKRLIAASRNGGAAMARGEILCFVDADYRIHPGTFEHVDHIMSARVGERRTTECHGGSVREEGVFNAEGGPPRQVNSAPRREGIDSRDEGEAVDSGPPFRYIGGGTGLVLERKSLALRITLLAIMPLLLALRIDGGVWFVRRKDFIEVGGYDESQMISEDVRLLWALKKLGKRRRPKQKLATRFDVKKAGVPGRPALAVCSTRKFDKHGDWHFLFDFYKAPLLYLFSRRRFEQYARSYWYEDDR